MLRVLLGSPRQKGSAHGKIVNAFPVGTRPARVAHRLETSVCSPRELGIGLSEVGCDVGTKKPIQEKYYFVNYV